MGLFDFHRLRTDAPAVTIPHKGRDDDDGRRD
jgi:hypothetical protein